MPQHRSDGVGRRLAAWAVAIAALGAADLCGSVLVPVRAAADPASAAAPPPPAPSPLEALVAHASVSDGAAAASSQCAGCHSFARGGPSLVGPDLYDVYGRRIASVPGYAYSSALSARRGAWDAASLDPWLANPTGDVPGTKMVIGGIGDPNERAQIIAFLRTLRDDDPGPER